MGIQIDKIKGPLLHKHKEGDLSGIDYTNAEPMPEKVHGLEVGTTFNKRTMKNMFDDLLYPYQYPAISGFGITGQSQLVEVGVNIDGDKSFNWLCSNVGNIIANSGIIKDISAAIELSTGIDLTLPPEVLAMVIPNIVPIAKSYRIEGVNSKNETFLSNLFNILSVYPIFSGVFNSPGATPTRPTAAQELINTGTKSVYPSNGGIQLTFDSVSDDYLWFAVPTTSTPFAQWHVTDLNAGNIGGAVSPGGNLFPDPDTINLTSLEALWNDIPYRVYISNYRTSVQTVTFYH